MRHLQQVTQEIKELGQQVALFGCGSKMTDEKVLDAFTVIACYRSQCVGYNVDPIVPQLEDALARLVTRKNRYADFMTYVRQQINGKRVKELKFRPIIILCNALGRVFFIRRQYAEMLEANALADECIRHMMSK